MTPYLRSSPGARSPSSASAARGWRRARALKRRRRRGRRLGRHSRRAATRPPPTAIAVVDLAEARLVWLRRFPAIARRAADASPAALDGREGQGRRASRSSAMSSCSSARASGRRSRQRSRHLHHRHQRKVDHHRADRACARTGWPRRADGRQYRHGGAGAGAARRTSRDPCHRVLELPDRPGALDQPRLSASR